MTGVSISITHPNGVTTTFSTVTQISWQPSLSINVQIGHYISTEGWVVGNVPVCSDYFQLDISEIDPTAALLSQVFSQLMASGAPLNGGTLI